MCRPVYGSCLSTFFGQQGLTAASGFLFERDQRLYPVTSRHVLIDKPSGHFPNRIELTLHTDAGNLTHATSLSVPLYKDGQSLWHQGRDAGGEIDVALIELDRASLPCKLLVDELLGLNSAWYADILMTLTAPAPSAAAQFLP